MKPKTTFFIGTASWSIPKVSRDLFIPEGAARPDHLKAYSKLLRGVEINSSFYKDHQPKTYAKWALATPQNFRFSIKLAKRFTHEQKLQADTTDLQAVLAGIANLGEKWGALLVQIPPKLIFEEGVAEDFFAAIREMYSGPIAFEARNESWVQRSANRVLEDYRISRVIADPDRLGAAPVVRGTRMAYFRLHGSPKVYYSNYEEESLRAWADRINEAAATHPEVWCIFDNTAASFATANALRLQSLLS